MTNDHDTTPPGRTPPPQEHQFGPDRPGNRKGRPKGAPNVKTIVEKVALDRHKVRKDGRQQRLTTVDLLLHTLCTKALNGDVQAATHLDRFTDRLQPEDAGSQCGYLLAPAPLTLEEWVEQYGAKDLDDAAVSGCGP